ncbi:para-aminobenzoate synthase, component I, putative [Aggregatibacter actinomycetemcomitans serotype e str. SC1083]|uniref:Para-aminobenzoate synthase, component I, putative n=1 Tax=Aggregatibacter actinomycetemcomitans serotype e str. SC1083 TaxID=907488 RepID=G4A6A2_AGGAC|nr:aminodeoxychorismate synthase component I [Aggregatibacter actinomycetemcomitans]EGY34867.1 para-aminobenzoate synthase, component I, putative [Aggregatibacter actinomycetemcomitans serotype e str. SC1083]KYK74650.1 para-aminobenzoate synthase [Aggregatibacter actinomycetemcomitans serotype e str. SA3096]KYK95128.1 para-aminobenzoate synthase [Aggregatibacter actinomycetemcomitans serotype e str. ANH9776]TYB21802.1 aminodeoxychorismate synthase component I [Aggregatibacter actinomycetemcomit
MWQDFIQQANQFGKTKTPFFFLIDFEQQKPILCSLNETAEQGIFVQFPGYTNVNWQEAPSEAFCLHKKPMDFAAYQPGFELVQRELHFGNSYLLNLTYPTPIETNYSLRQLFWQSQAKYKLLFKDQFVCFSPECFVNLRDNRIFTYPMKGTIDATLPDAQALLLNNPKEQREHYTIVDLMRNDLATVAKNIQVTRFRYVEEIQTEQGAILQTSSEICGELAKNWQGQIGSILANLLPAGSISGAPKEKTVQIIQRAEQQPRGYYTGIFGIFDGESLQSAVAIRFIEQTGKGLFFRSGGGITIQSDAQEEYRELIQKVYVPLKRG